MQRAQSDCSLSSPLSCKVVLIGESGVGKTSVISRYTNNSFSSVMLASTGGSFATKNLYLEEENQQIKFEIWDTAGQEQYRSITQIFYKNASCCILVYEVTRRDSFEELEKYWIKEIKKSAPKDAIIAVIGNKNDMYEYEEVSENEGKAFAKENGAIFKLTSAKLGLGIEELFMIIAKKFINPLYEDGSNLNKIEEEERRKQKRIEELRTKSISTYDSRLLRRKQIKEKKCC